jgi:hypothetical protein
VEWEHNSEGGDYDWRAWADDGSDDELCASFESLWSTLRTEGLASQIDRWDHLRLEIWADSGRVIVFPARSPFRERIDNVCFQLEVPRLLRLFEELDGDALYAQVSALEKRIVALARKAYRRADWRDAPPVRCWSYGDISLGKF